MYKAGDKIKVHFFDKTAAHMGEIKTRNYNKVFTIYRDNGILGIDWSGFTPLDSFATSNGAVVFELV